MTGIALLLAACDRPRRAAAVEPAHRVVSVDAGQEHSSDQVLDEIARSLVGAYEALGKLQQHYDTDGDCMDDDEGCTVWRFRSTNPTLSVVLSRFMPHPTESRPAGSYEGFVSFVDRRTRRLRRIDIRLRYAAEEIDVDLAFRDPSVPRTTS